MIVEINQLPNELRDLYFLVCDILKITEHWDKESKELMNDALCKFATKKLNNLVIDLVGITKKQ